MYPLISVWNILPGKEAEVIAALKELAVAVEHTQPGTLAYLVHTPDLSQQNLPAPAAGDVIFFEIYKDKQAFDDHVESDAFKNFVKIYGPLFLSTDKGGPYTSVEFMIRHAGFIRPGIS